MKSSLANIQTFHNVTFLETNLAYRNTATHTISRRMLPLNLLEKKKFIELVADNVRADGRTLIESRKITMEFNRTTDEFSSDNPYGCSSFCLVNFGETKVISFVNCEIVEPYKDKPNEGFFQLSTHFDPIASEVYDLKSKSTESLRISALIDLSIKESGSVDLEALCIASGEKVWKILVNIHILNRCGNLEDACSLACIGSLSHFRRPEVDFENDKIKVYSFDEREPIPLSIIHWPICISFGLVYVENIEILSKNENHDEKTKIRKTIALNDITTKEEQLIDGNIHIIINEHGEYCAIEKNGWPPVTNDLIEKCCVLAKQIVKQRLSLLLDQ